MANSVAKYLFTGVKLMLVLLIGSLVMLIPYGLSMLVFAALPAVGAVLYLIFFILSLALDGFLIIKFRKFIFG